MKDSELIFGLMGAFGKAEYSIADLIHLITPFDITETCLRTTLSRMAAKELVTARHEGKKVFYSFSEKGERIKSNIASSFNVCDWGQWDGRWWGVLFSVPDIHKSERHYIRTKLSAYRFTSLYPGFWIRPLRREEHMENRLAKIFNNPHCRIIHFNFFDHVSLAQVDELWGLSAINQEFSRGIDLLHQSFTGLNKLTPVEALVERMTVGDQVVKILETDPQLPVSLLPPDWRGNMLKRLFMEWDKAVEQAARPYTEKIYHSEVN